MTKIEYPFLIITVCWKPSHSVPWIQKQGGEESGRFMKRCQEDNKAVSSCPFSLGIENGLWPFTGSRELVTNIKHRHEAILPGKEWTFPMQGITWEQMIHKEHILPTSWRSTGFGYLLPITIASHSFPLNCNTNLTCFSLNLLLFIISMPPVFPREHCHCWVHFNRSSCLLNHGYAIWPCTQFFIKLLILVRRDILGWVVWACNETISKHARHLLLFSHSQSKLSCPRRRLQQSDVIWSWKIFFPHYLLILTHALLIYYRLFKRQKVTWLKPKLCLFFPLFCKDYCIRLFHSFTCLPINHSFSDHHSLSQNSLALFSGYCNSSETC